METQHRVQLDPLPPGVRTLRDTEAALLSRLHPLPYTPRNCVTCFGAGWFRWLHPETGEEVEYDCNCIDQYILHRWLSHSGVPLSYQRLGWGDLVEGAVSEAVTEKVFDYLGSPHYRRAGLGLTLYGSRGNGKTLLATLAVKWLIREGVPCFVTTFADMAEAYAGGWKDPEREEWFTRTIRNAQVLYIDDVGREHKANRYDGAALSEEEKKQRALADNRPGSMKEALLEATIRHRVGSSLPTIITTNYTPEEVGQGYGGHTLSLLSEKQVEVEVEGSDRRSEMKRREADYANRGLSRPVTLA